MRFLARSPLFQFLNTLCEFWNAIDVYASCAVFETLTRYRSRKDRREVLAHQAGRLTRPATYPFTQMT